MASLRSQAEVVLLLVLRQAAHLILCCYEAPHLLGEEANPLLLMLEYQPQPLGLPMVAGYNTVVRVSSDNPSSYPSLILVGSVSTLWLSRSSDIVRA